MLNEARRNKTTINRKGSNIESLVSTYGSGEYFVSFTDVEKIGVNPRTTHNTPIGVYAYPLSETTVQSQLLDNSIPYASDRKFVNVLQPTDPTSVIDLSKQNNWVALMERADSVFFEKASFLDSSNNPINLSPVQRQEFAEKVVRPFASKGRLSNSPNTFWSVTRAYAIILNANLRPHFVVSSNGLNIDIDTTKDLFNALMNEYYSGYAVAWTYLFRRMGVSIIVDRGQGIIHGNEPTQAVFLDPKSYQVVDRLTNTYAQRHEIIEIHKPKNLSRFLNMAFKNDVVSLKVSYVFNAIMKQRSYTTGLGRYEIIYKPHETKLSQLLVRFLEWAKRFPDPFVKHDLGQAVIYAVQDNIKDTILLKTLDPSYETDLVTPINRILIDLVIVLKGEEYLVEYLETKFPNLVKQIMGEYHGAVE